MRVIEVYTAQALEIQLREHAKRKEWGVFKFNGYTFKVFGLWAQIMQNPAGQRDSGFMGHKTQKALISEVLRFIGEV